MAFSKKTWKDRVTQYPSRRVLTDINTSQTQTVTVTRSEGTVTEAGDIFNATSMNDLENRINNGFTDANTALTTLTTNQTATSSTSKTNVTVGSRSDGSCTWYKYGPWVTFESRLIGSGAKTYTLSDFIPAGYRPAHEIRAAITGMASGAISQWGAIIMSTNGQIVIYTSSTSAVEFCFSLTYNTVV